MLEQWYSMSGNPHHFALPTPPSDHETEASMYWQYYFEKKLIFS